jgi:succinate--hydroxymethylglutarate CoA-transferase
MMFKIAGLANIASNYLIAGKGAGRHGTAHPSIVPYQVSTHEIPKTKPTPFQVFPCKDGYVMIGAGNDQQFKIFCQQVLGRDDIPLEAKFATNSARVANREELVLLITEIMEQHERSYWLEKLTGLG